MTLTNFGQAVMQQNYEELFKQQVIWWGELAWMELVTPHTTQIRKCTNPERVMLRRFIDTWQIVLHPESEMIMTWQPEMIPESFRLHIFTHPIGGEAIHEATVTFNPPLAGDLLHLKQPIVVTPWGVPPT